MKTHIRFAVAALAFAFGAGATAETVIEGHIIDPLNQPMHGAQVHIQLYGKNASDVVVRTNADGNYSVDVPPANYRVTIHAYGIDFCTADNVKTRVGDPWRVNFNFRYALLEISTEHSQKVRRFSWQAPITGSHLDGRWMETTAYDGYEPRALNMGKPLDALAHAYLRPSLKHASDFSVDINKP